MTQQNMKKHKQCKTNAAKHVQKTQKQVTKGSVGMQQNANNMQQKIDRNCPLKQGTTNARKCTKQKQHKSEQKRSVLYCFCMFCCCLFVFRLPVLLRCFLFFSFLVRFLGNKQTNMQTNRKQNATKSEDTHKYRTQNAQTSQRKSHKNRWCVKLVHCLCVLLLLFCVFF